MTTPHTPPAAPDLAAIGARAAAYERAGWDVTASGPGAEGRATVTRCDAAAHASALLWWEWAVGYKGRPEHRGDKQGDG